MEYHPIVWLFMQMQKEQSDVRVGLFFFNKYYFKQVLAYLEAFFFNSAFFNVSAPT